MPNDIPPNDWKSLWQSQKVEPVTMPLEEIRRKALGFQRGIRNRNLVEYAAALIVLVYFGSTMFHYPGLMRAGAALIIAGVLHMVWQLHRRGSNRSVPSDLAVHSCIAFHRRELERQRDLVRNVWSWYLGPMIPGIAVMLLSGLLASPGRMPHPKLFVTGYAAVVAIAFYVVGRLNLRAARKLQRTIDALKEMERDSL
jgi:hypothetical protein